MRYIGDEKVKQKMLLEGFIKNISIDEFVDSIPSEDVEEVKHGKWIKKRHQIYECSRCKRSIYLEGLNVTDENEAKLLRKLYPYCHCGAIMDLGSEYEIPVEVR